MPTNLLKIYNELLELFHTNQKDNLASLRRVFDRDIANNPNFQFRGLQIHPTTAEGEDKMDRLFRHLTTVITDPATRKREFESERSVRLHWIKYHVNEQKPGNIIVFSVENENRSYILDKQERYVIILEPLRNKAGFYLLTAYKLLPANFKIIMNKYEKRGKDGLL
jgi:hypothetical protein